MISRSYTLPCGVKLKNRIIKSAMSENMAYTKFTPGKEFQNLYRTWSNGGAGVLISGNIMIDSSALGEPYNIVVAKNIDNFKELRLWAESVKKGGSELWAQLNHPGKQSPKFLSPEPIAPSSIEYTSALKNMFNKPRELTVFEISELVSAFGHAAGKLKAAGFTGVQIHGAHGYLVSQFLSPLHNQRTDEYGGSLENRMNFVCDIYDSIRSEVGANFPIGIKLNSADFQKGGFSQEDSVKVVEKLSDMGIDLIEVSGGTYESPEMMTGSIKESTQKREAYFQDYCKLIRHIKAPILLTGGFRTSSGMNNALESKACDFIGLARSIAIDPDFANKVLSEAEVSSPVKPLKSGSKFIDKLIPLEIVWYTEQIHRLGKNKLTSENMSVKWVALKTFFSLGKNIFKKVRV